METDARDTQEPDTSEDSSENADSVDEAVLQRRRRSKVVRVHWDSSTIQYENEDATWTRVFEIAKHFGGEAAYVTAAYHHVRHGNIYDMHTGVYTRMEYLGPPRETRDRESIQVAIMHDIAVGLSDYDYRGMHIQIVLVTDDPLFAAMEEPVVGLGASLVFVSRRPSLFYGLRFVYNFFSLDLYLTLLQRELNIPVEDDPNLQDPDDLELRVPPDINVLADCFQIVFERAGSVKGHPHYRQSVFCAPEKDILDELSKRSLQFYNDENPIVRARIYLEFAVSEGKIMKLYMKRREPGMVYYLNQLPPGTTYEDLEICLAIEATQH